MVVTHILNVHSKNPLYTMIQVEQFSISSYQDFQFLKQIPGFCRVCHI